MTKLPFNEVILILQGMGSGSPRQISADAGELPATWRSRSGRLMCPAAVCEGIRTSQKNVVFPIGTRNAFSIFLR